MYVKFAIAVLVWRSRKEGYESLRDLSKESLIVRGRSVKERSHPSLFSASDGWIRHSCLVSMATHKERYWRYWIRSTPCRTFVNNDYSRYSSVSSMLTDLNRPSLQSRRRICDLVCFIKYMTWRPSKHLPSLWPHLRACVWQYSTRASHDFKIRLPSSSVDAYPFFYVRSIPVWNALSADVVSS